MDIGTRVEYQTDRAEIGVGIVERYCSETEIVTVRDEDDGSVWLGPADKTINLP